MLHTKDLTIYIPVYCRQKLLNPIIDYYSDTNAAIIICDASPKSFAPHLFRGNNKVSYYHLPDASHGYRYTYATEKCETQFFVPRADRRHQTKKFLCEGLKFLRQNNDYDFVQGLWINQIGTPFYGTDLISKAGEQDNSMERIFYFSGLHDPPYYSIQRIEKAKAHGAIMSDIEKITDNPYIIEQVLAFYTYFSSKIITLPVLQGIIQSIGKKMNYTVDVYKVSYLYDSPEFRSLLFDALLKYLSPSKNVVEVRRSFDNYLNAAIFYFYFFSSFSIPSLNQGNCPLPRFSLLQKLYNYLHSGEKCLYQDTAIKTMLNQHYVRNVEFADFKKYFELDDFKELMTLKGLISDYNREPDDSSSAKSLIADNKAEMFRLSPRRRAKRSLNGATLRGQDSSMLEGGSGGMAYYSSPDLYRDHVMISLEEYKPGQTPAWLRNETPLTETLFFIQNGKAVRAWNQATKAFEVDCGLAGGKKFWGLRVLKSELPRLVAVGNKHCFDMQEGGRQLPSRLVFTPAPGRNMSRKCLARLADIAMPFCAEVECRASNLEELPSICLDILTQCARHNCIMTLRAEIFAVQPQHLDFLNMNLGRIIFHWPEDISDSGIVEAKKHLSSLLKKIDRDRVEIYLDIKSDENNIEKILKIIAWAEDEGFNGVLTPPENGVNLFHERLLEYAIFHPDENFYIFAGKQRLKNPHLLGKVKDIFRKAKYKKFTCAPFQPCNSDTSAIYVNAQGECAMLPQGPFFQLHEVTDFYQLCNALKGTINA